jgi:hypothetical protein
MLMLQPHREHDMPAYYEFQISVKGIEPRIWRRFQIIQSATFKDLHDAIQTAGTWESRHLYVFRNDSLSNPDVPDIAGIPDPDEVIPTTPDARKVKLKAYFGRLGTTQCRYIYDFGDDWEVDVVLTAAGELDERFKRRLLDGERAFPPEDAGGVEGYERFVGLLETGKDPWGDNARELKRWLAGWIPECFDLDVTKRVFNRF